jgi:hypothetical protein
MYNPKMSECNLVELNETESENAKTMGENNVHWYFFMLKV